MKKLLIIAGIILAVVALGFTFAPKEAQAATIPLSGYAWSENIGWIHFKSSGSPAYGVLVDSSNGLMSGFAWSENLGWLSFNSSDLSGCPSGTCTASLNIQSGAMSGWAKFLSTGEWVHLAGSGYGVTYSSQSNEFSGYAWGDTDAGWIKWKNNNPAYVVISESPIVAPPAAPSGLSATAISTSRIDLAWNDNSSGETGFKIERKTGAGGTYAEITTTNPNVTSYSNTTGLSPNTTYYYRVRATNNGGDSVYSNEANATTLQLTSTISVSINPDASWTINPGNLQRTGDTSVTVNPSGQGTVYTITPGTYPGYENPTCTFNTGSGGGSGCSMTLFGNESASFTVTYTVSFNYSLSNDGSVSVQKGGVDQFGQSVITKDHTAGATQSIDLSASGLPSGVSYSIANQGCTLDCTSTISFTVTPSASAGTYPITVTGSPLGKTTQFNLIITNSPDMFISCAKTPSSAEVGQTVTWTANITQPGAGAPYLFSWTGTNVPGSLATFSAENQSFDIVYSTTGTKTVTATVRDRLSNVAVCQPQGSINIGVSPIFEEF